MNLREEGGFLRRLHSSLHFSAASENNASPTQSARHYSLLLRPFSTTTTFVVDSRSQFCTEQRSVQTDSPSRTNLPPFSFSSFLSSSVARLLQRIHKLLLPATSRITRASIATNRRYRSSPILRAPILIVSSYVSRDKIWPVDKNVYIICIYRSCKNTQDAYDTKEKNMKSPFLLIFLLSCQIVAKKRYFDAKCLKRGISSIVNLDLEEIDSSALATYCNELTL